MKSCLWDIKSSMTCLCWLLKGKKGTIRSYLGSVHFLSSSIITHLNSFIFQIFFFFLLMDISSKYFRTFINENHLNVLSTQHARYHPKCFICVNSVNPYNAMSWILPLTPFHRWGSKSTPMWPNLPPRQFRLAGALPTALCSFSVPRTKSKWLNYWQKALFINRELSLRPRINLISYN